MSQVILLPRLPAANVRHILESHELGRPPKMDKRSVERNQPEGMWYAPTGGTTSLEPIFEIGDHLRRTVIGCGSASAVSRSRFDQEAAIYLAGHDALQGGEALRDDVWAFLATVVAPDVVAWRFSSLRSERFEGGVRNTFQRLWLRARALDRGESHPDRWELVREMPEDAAVAIIERTSIAARHTVSLALAEGWLEMVSTAPSGARASVMRLATKLLRLENQLIDLAALPDEELEQAVNNAFCEAQSLLGTQTAKSSSLPEVSRAAR